MGRNNNLLNGDAGMKFCIEVSL
ncbi:hypothetical protein Tco_0711301, partial [Tanacetum coccineum]